MKNNSAFCSVLQGHPAVASPKEKLYEQTTSNPAFTERNIQKPNAYLLDSRLLLQQKSLVTYLSLLSLYVCVWLVNTLTYTAPIGSPIICMWSPADICEQWERDLSFGSAGVRWAGTPDEPLRTSAWEAKISVRVQIGLEFSSTKGKQDWKKLTTHAESFDECTIFPFCLFLSFCFRTLYPEWYCY